MQGRLRAHTGRGVSPRRRCVLEGGGGGGGRGGGLNTDCTATTRLSIAFRWAATGAVSCVTEGSSQRM